MEFGQTSYSRTSLGEGAGSGFQLTCPRFDGTNFRGWWSKLEQFFEAENIEDTAKVCLVMLNLEGRALE